ncbi:Ribonuclease Z [Verticillium dahliae VDG1]|nr:Ribonuclease Z [Verticillium dahliae VDG1]
MPAGTSTPDLRTLAAGDPTTPCLDRAALLPTLPIPSHLALTSRPTKVVFAVVQTANVLVEVVSPRQASDHEAPPPPERNDSRDPELPRFRLSQVKEHGPDSERPWVTHEDKVYDITDWIGAHPGGDVILRAAGGSIDPYWNIFTVHKAPYVREILAQYMIGLIDVADLVDGQPPAELIEDPFRDDPARDQRLVIMTSKPRNAETPLDELAETFVTPQELFYVRNHMWVPKVEDPKQHTLTIELLDGTTKDYTVEDLKTKFKPVKIAATLQCSGNRRKDMTTHARDTNGIQWNVGAISNAVWEGVKLSDVLADAGFPLAEARAGDTDARHVQFAGLESYGASIPIDPVLDPRGDVILAYAMNGAPLPPDHGFPLRALVPGYVAARSVKWLRRLGPWTAVPPMKAPGGRLLTPPPEARGREAAVTGYAYSGGGRRIVRVDDHGHKSWAWQRWRYDGVVPFGDGPEGGKVCSTLLVKATDEAYNAQPDGYEAIWNFRGHLTNAWHRYRVCSECQAEKAVNEDNR